MKKYEYCGEFPEDYVQGEKYKVNEKDYVSYERDLFLGDVIINEAWTGSTQWMVVFTTKGEYMLREILPQDHSEWGYEDILEMEGDVILYNAITGEEYETE